MYTLLWVDAWLPIEHGDGDVTWEPRTTARVLYEVTHPWAISACIDGWLAVAQACYGPGELVLTGPEGEAVAGPWAIPSEDMAGVG